MRVMRTLAAFEPDTALVIGSFDGMHLGHAALIDRARAYSRHVAMLSLWPHPSVVLSPRGGVPLLQTLRQRWSCAQTMGVHEIAHVEFDTSVARMSPSDFVDDMLVRVLAPTRVVVGEDFRFGLSRAGDTTFLAQRLGAAGIACDVVAHRLDDAGDKLGSSAIRRLLAQGDVGAAARMLGRPFAIEGRVDHGAGRGRGLGFRTANITTPRQLWPQVGVYAATLVLLESPDAARLEPMAAAANLGFRPTVDGENGSDGLAPRHPTLEVHVLDKDLGEDLYERDVEVAFVARIRDERRFESVDQLRAAIASDVAQCRRILDPETVRQAHAAALTAEQHAYLAQIATRAASRTSATASPEQPIDGDHPEPDVSGGQSKRPLAPRDAPLLELGRRKAT